jgi:hypothetical protein
MEEDQKEKAVRDNYDSHLGGAWHFVLFGILAF